MLIVWQRQDVRQEESGDTVFRLNLSASPFTFVKSLIILNLIILYLFLWMFK